MPANRVRGNSWAGLPGIKPMLATLGQLPPAAQDPDFAYEIKWDGVRAVGYVAGHRFHLVSRNDRDITVAYPELVPGRAPAGGDLVLDGEIVAFDRQGKPSFAALQPRMHLRDETRIARESERSPAAYVVFDVLHRHGRDLTRLPYRERRDILESIELPDGSGWQCPAYQLGDGAALYAATREQGLEGVMAKAAGSLYRPGARSADWIKVKHLHEQEVVVGGWTEGEGRRAGVFGALLLGVPGEHGLDYVGNVGTGFTDRDLHELGRRLEALAADRSPFAGHLPASAARAAHWVEPELVAEVTYVERTRDGYLRTPSWRGLRTDKEPADINVE
ncbi:MAG TPA: non-homologous end-joining DNA ligase [Actinocrinis sp.]|jgi:bifunctional non-homologous end joining protein LigD